MRREHIEDIYFFEVNPKYMNLLKISVISRVREMSKIADIFNTWNEIFLHLPKKKVFFFSF